MFQRLPGDAVLQILYLHSSRWFEVFWNPDCEEQNVSGGKQEMKL